jgi:hypothetical protein
VPTQDQKDDIEPVSWTERWDSRIRHTSLQVSFMTSLTRPVDNAADAARWSQWRLRSRRVIYCQQCKTQRKISAKS